MAKPPRRRRPDRPRRARRPVGVEVLIPDPVAALPPLPKDYTFDEAVAEMEALYAQLSPLLCRGLCHDTCQTVSATELEYQRIANAGATLGPHMTPHPRVVEMLVDERSPCPALGPLKNCTIYKMRPFVCRAYGQTQLMQCRHGCKPERMLSTAESDDILARIEQLSRHVTGVRRWPTW